MDFNAQDVWDGKVEELGHDSRLLSSCSLDNDELDTMANHFSDSETTDDSNSKSEEQGVHLTKMSLHMHPKFPSPHHPTKLPELGIQTPQISPKPYALTSQRGGQLLIM